MDRWNSQSLFNDDRADAAPPVEGVPLAERMRPRSLEEFVGQTHLVGEGRISAEMQKRVREMIKTFLERARVKLEAEPSTDYTDSLANESA